MQKIGLTEPHIFFAVTSKSSTTNYADKRI